MTESIARQPPECAAGASPDVPPRPTIRDQRVSSASNAPAGSRFRPPEAHEHREAKTSYVGPILGCGYNLAGNNAGVCPERGPPLRAADRLVMMRKALLILTCLLLAASVPVAVVSITRFGSLHYWNGGYFWHANLGGGSVSFEIRSPGRAIAMAPARGFHVSIRSTHPFGETGWRPLTFAMPTAMRGLTFPGWLPTALLTLVACWLVRSCLRSRPRGAGFCLTCGYDLTGNRSGVCPECGTPIERRP